MREGTLGIIAGILLAVVGFMACVGDGGKETFEAQMVEAYERYGVDGESLYSVDFREISTGRIVTEDYNRQVWRSMHGQEGTIFVLKRLSDVGVTGAFGVGIGIFLIICGAIKREFD